MGPGAWLGGVAAAALAAAALRPVPVLEIDNTSRGGTWRLPLAAGETFAVTSRHSIYDQPVTEEFSAAPDGGIALRAVASPSAAVREYFGITAPGERHAVERVLGRIAFRVAMGTPQALRLGGRERSFLEFGDHGDRLVMQLASEPAVARWLAIHP